MRLGLLLWLMMVLAIPGCGGGSGGGNTHRLTIAPSSVSLSTGGTQTFKVAGADAGEAVDALHLQWSCTGGTLSLKNDLSMNYRAGDKSGHYSITASDGRLSGSASIEIR